MSKVVLATHGDVATPAAAAAAAAQDAPICQCHLLPPQEGHQHSHTHRDTLTLMDN